MARTLHLGAGIVCVLAAVPSCSVALTYHTANDALLCHYCGYQTARITCCAYCGSEMIRLSEQEPSGWKN